MNQKIAKKIRKVNREFNSDFVQKVLQPKPKWISWKVWIYFLGKFIKIDDVQK